MVQGENLLRSAPEELIRRPPQETLYSRADHYRAPVAGKQQQPVVENAQNLVHVLAKRAENFAHAAQLLSDLADFRADLAELVAALKRFLVELAARNLIQLCGNALQRS